jgi:methionyl-tRNA formyltransferase
MTLNTSNFAGQMTKKDLRIVFFGTPDFAVASLKAIVEAGYQVVAVVTAPDKAAGRGYQLQSSAVKKAALELGLDVLQPEKLKSPEFIETLKSYQADIQIVIAFRMLPEMVWNMPVMGTFNLHASLLPAYRGAAPINHAIINGETETGNTTFFLKHEIDTGAIILQDKVAILPEDNAGTLHDKLMLNGAELVVKSLDAIISDTCQLSEQQQGEFPIAPKIFTETCQINWQQNAVKVHNLIRGLSPYPAAFTEFMGKKLKIYGSNLTDEVSSQPGLIEPLGKDRLIAHCADYLLNITDVQYEGKKRMPVKDFLNGLKTT